MEWDACWVGVDVGRVVQTSGGFRWRKPVCLWDRTVTCKGSVYRTLLISIDTEGEGAFICTWFVFGCDGRSRRQIRYRL